MSTDGTTQVLDTGAPDGPAREVASYVARVRAALGDLGPEEVDDLTGGMEADLGELLAERGGPLERVLGAPTLYAAELRAAAGLPAAPASARTVDVGAWLRHRRARATRAVDARPWLRSVVDGLVSLRPAWWVARAFLAAVTVVWFLGRGFIPSLEYRRTVLTIVTLLLLVLSVRLGRRGGSAGGRGGERAVGRLLGLGFAGAALMGALVVWVTPVADPVYVGGSTVTTSTLSYEGRDIGNLYLYDAQGHRLQDVRVFDDLGHLVLLSRTGDLVRPDLTVPGVRDADGHEWTNAFPRPWTVDGAPWALPPEGTVYPVWSPPASLPPLSTPTGGVTVTTTPTPAPPTTTAPSTTTR